MTHRVMSCKTNDDNKKIVHNYLVYKKKGRGNETVAQRCFVLTFIFSSKHSGCVITFCSHFLSLFIFLFLSLSVLVSSPSRRDWPMEYDN